MNDVITNGAVSAGWTLNGSFVIIGALLVLIAAICGWVFVSSMTAIKDEIQHIHTRIAERADEHNELKDDHIELRTRVLIVEAREKTESERLADIIVTKLKAM